MTPGKYLDEALHKLTTEEAVDRIRVLTSLCREAWLVLDESESDAERATTRRRLRGALLEAGAAD